MEPKKKLTRRDFLQRGFLATVGGTGLYAALLEPEWLALDRIDIPIQDLPPAFDGYKIAVISDVHYPRQIEVPFLNRAFDLVKEAKADVLVMPGDFCDGKGLTKVPALAGVFAMASAPDGVFGVLGNHDHWFDADAVKKELLGTPIRLIDNKSVRLSRGGAEIALGGIGDLWCDLIDPERAFEGVPKEMPRILLSHNPDFAEDYERDERIDLQISGHTHGGEVRLPWGYSPIVPSKYGQKFRAGLASGKSHRVYTSRGICSPRHVRLFCRPEVSLITLRSTAGQDV